MQINSLSPPYILTADIGGSHITVGICALETYTVSDKSIVRMDVDSRGSANDILTSWGSAFEQVLRKNPGLSIDGLSIAMPGPFDYEKGISFITGLNKYEALYGKDIKQHFAGYLNIDHQLVKFRNDAESTIAGEAWAGAGKGFQRVMGVTLGTGFGSAYCEHNITRDANLGSEPYKDSIADDHLSTRWFLKRYQELTGISLTGGVRELAELASTKPVARDIFEEFAENMIDFLSGPVARFAPEVLILCGNIARASDHFLPHLQTNLNSTNIRLAQLNEYAPLIGAAAMFDNRAKPTSFNSVNQL
jgi:glucokinase